MAEGYTGVKVVTTRSEIINEIYKNKKIDIFDNRHTWYENMYVVIKDETGGQQSALGVVKGHQIHLLRDSYSAQGIVARNKEQKMAMDALLDDDIRVAVLTGRAGSGKTLISLASAIEKIQQKKYKRIILTRPMSFVGKYSLGALPGPQPLDAKVLTPDGWKEMGDILLGDWVTAGDGTAAQVVGVYPKGIKDVYRVYTTDGTHTECCLDHAWYTQTKEERKRNRRGQIRSTQEILDTLNAERVFGGRKRMANHCIPRNKVVDFIEKEVFIPPYTLGVLLGDGSFSRSISFSNVDKELVDKVKAELDQLGCNIRKCDNSISYNISRKERGFNKTARSVKVTELVTNHVVVYSRIGVAIEQTGLSRGKINNACATNKPTNGLLFEFLPPASKWVNPIKEGVDKLGLLGKHAFEKFIPDVYLYNSVFVRLELLRGLMDADGTVKKIGESSFCTTSEELARGVIELVRSLGGRAILRQRNRVGKENEIKERTIITKRLSFEFTISLPEQYNPFYVSRKSKRYKQKFIHGVWINKIERVGEKQVQCIKIRHPDHLYITDDYIVTHNTVDEKFGPYLENYMCNLEFMFGEKKDCVADVVEQCRMEFIPMQLLRGASWNNCFVLVDETQILDYHEMLTLGTRVSEGSKIVIMGDLAQRDEKIARHKTGIYKFVNSSLAKEASFVSSIELLKSERGVVAELFADVFEAH